MRLRKIPAAKQYLADASHVLTLTAESQLLTLNEKRDTELEIGCGKGDFIIKRATLNPKNDYYALEKYDSVLLKAVKKQEQTEMENLTFVLGDAEHLLTMFPSRSLTKLYLNFSDPWPKKKHAKRRLTYSKKLQMYEQLLKPTGVLEMKTDNQSLFESTLRELSYEHWHIDEISLDLYQDEHFKETKAFQTEYEKKFIAKQKRIYYLQAHKIV